MEAFEDLYKMLGTKFDYYFLESAMADIGREIVKDNKGKIFEESDGAIVFKAEKYDPEITHQSFYQFHKICRLMKQKSLV